MEFTLQNRLKKWVGIRGLALDWFHSYLTDRSVSVAIGKASSPRAPLSCDVLQGSILGPLLFSIYMLPLEDTILKHNVQFQCYAGDYQLYVSFKPGETGHLSCVLSCLTDIKCWMSQNFLQPNLRFFYLAPLILSAPCSRWCCLDFSRVRA